MLFKKPVSDLHLLLNGGVFGLFKDIYLQRLEALNLTVLDMEDIFEQRKISLKSEHDKEFDKLGMSEGTQDYIRFLYSDKFEIRHVTVYDSFYKSTFSILFSLFENGLKFLYNEVASATGKDRYPLAEGNIDKVIKAF